MKKNKLNILDYTLRDSGYYNNLYFEKNFIYDKLIKNMKKISFHKDKYYNTLLKQI